MVARVGKLAMSFIRSIPFASGFCLQSLDEQVEVIVLVAPQPHVHLHEEPVSLNPLRFSCPVRLSFTYSSFILCSRIRFFPLAYAFLISSLYSALTGP